MNTPDPDTNAALLAGLEALKGAKLSNRRKGFHTRLRMWLTPAEHKGLVAMRALLSLHVGRLISLPLVTRLALLMLAERCARAVNDPVEIARLRADLLATRDERLSELRAARQ